MKIKIHLTLCIALFSVVFASAQDNRNFQAECHNLEREGYITIRIWDTKKGVRYKLIQARKDAINMMLFSGISGNNDCPTQPPILNTSKAKESFKTLEKAFFSKKGEWTLYTMSSTTESIEYSKLGKKKLKVYEVSLYKAALRKYLEEQNVIKKLNDGF